MNRYFLEPKFLDQKSFGYRAEVTVSGGALRLYSYGTHVATIADDKVTVYDYNSSTTIKHIKEFLKQHGFKAESLGQMREDYPAVNEMGEV